MAGKVRAVTGAFHTDISIDEFKYALGIWAHVFTGKLSVEEFDKIPADAGLLTLSFPVGSDGEQVVIQRQPGSKSFKALLAIGKEFYQFPEKCISILLHCVVWELIMINPIFDKYIKSRAVFDSPYLNIIKDIPIKIGEESAINNFNWEYILQKFQEAEIDAEIELIDKNLEDIAIKLMREA